MLIPRFTIRGLLLLTTVCGVFFAVLTAALRGQIWAAAVSIAVAAVALAFIVYGLLFLWAYVWAGIFGLGRSQSRGASPFASAGPPPQLIPPEDPE